MRTLYLVPSTVEHIRELMTWLADEPSVRIWGGPLFRFPFTEETFLEDVHWGKMATYALVDPEGVLIAFGQWYEKTGRVHLAYPQAGSNTINRIRSRQLVYAADLWLRSAAFGRPISC